MKGKASKKLIRGQKGQVLMMVMVLLLFGSVIVASVLSYMSSGLKTGKEVFEERMYLSYAADAGIEDALWQVKNRNLPNLLSGYEQYGYNDDEDNPMFEWEYNLEQDTEYGENGIVNDADVNVAFQNAWMPKGISAPSLSEAEDIAIDGRLAVYGSMSGASGTEFEIKIYYYYNDENPGEPDYDPLGENLKVKSIGIWLPPGFEYNDSLEGVPSGVVPSVDDEPYKGGQAVVWNFPASPTYPKLKDFASGSSSTNPMVRKITFEFTGPEGRTPSTALAWIESTGVTDISYSWDCSVKIYKITSVATRETEAGTKEATVDAYAATTEVLKRGAAISGDYCAIGGTLMTTTDDYKYRDMLFKESSATVQSSDPEAPFYVPPDAHVELAYLYWTGWLENAGIWGDNCDTLNNWTTQTSPTYPYRDWSIYYSDRFRGHAYFAGEEYRTLTMISGVDLHYYLGQTVQISWHQSENGSLEDGDILWFAFSGDGGESWEPLQEAFHNDISPTTKTVNIPIPCLTDKFKMKFYIEGFNEGSGGNEERAYIDDIAITLVGGSPIENARVNQIMFNGTKITAPLSDVQTRYTGGGSLSYSCQYDVTSLVTANGAGTYMVGHVMDWPGDYQMYYPSGSADGTTAFPLGTPAYKDENGQWIDDTQLSHAAWSLILIYSSPDTAGHQLYLYPDFAYAANDVDLDFDGDGNGGGVIGGFIAPEAVKYEEYAARLTVFVGEGDDWICGTDYHIEELGHEYVEVEGDLLWDGTYSVRIPGSNTLDDPYNPWNEMSTGLSASGIDIDTFTVAYPTIKPGAVKAEIHLHTGTDNWDLVYIIISFRSEIVPAGTVSYIMR